jgi:hypothetical protein
LRPAPPERLAASLMGLVLGTHVFNRVVRHERAAATEEQPPESEPEAAARIVETFLRGTAVTPAAPARARRAQRRKARPE